MVCVTYTETFVDNVNHYYNETHNHPKYAHATNRFLLGKSIGGVISAYTVIKHPNKYKGLIGLAGAYKPHPDQQVSSMLMNVLRAVNALYSKLLLRQIFDPKLIVSNEDILKKWYNDPLCSKDKIKVGYTVDGFRYCHELPKLVCDINISMLMMVGNDDCVVSLKGLKMMMTNCKKQGEWEDHYLAKPRCQPKIKIYEGGG